ncbi:hypothetical protein [Streptomyces sp. NPDC019507]|uniref:hypothetical protein n=1 Tax=Streptomyces sp. NPDC019507 TaxID=3154689 RepID=UPI0033CB61D0
MGVAAITTTGTRTEQGTRTGASTGAAKRVRRPAGRPALSGPAKRPLPAGLPREWYESHNRRLKAMRLAIALLDTGVYHPANASNRRIRATAERIGIHPPSDTTCRMVRSLIHDAD